MSQKTPDEKTVLTKAYELVKKDAHVSVFRRRNYVAIKVTPRNPGKVLRELRDKKYLVKKFFSNSDPIKLVDILILKRSFAIIYKYPSEEEAKKAEEMFKEIFSGKKVEDHDHSPKTKNGLSNKPLVQGNDRSLQVREEKRRGNST